MKLIKTLKRAPKPVITPDMEPNQIHKAYEQVRRKTIAETESMVLCSTVGGEVEVSFYDDDNLSAVFTVSDISRVEAILGSLNEIKLREYLKTRFPLGESVIASPKNGDFAFEFDGRISGYKDNFIQVTDQDDNTFDCEEDQLRFDN